MAVVVEVVVVVDVVVEVVVVVGVKVLVYRQYRTLWQSGTAFDGVLFSKTWTSGIFRLVGKPA